MPFASGFEAGSGTNGASSDAEAPLGQHADSAATRADRGLVSGGDLQSRTGPGGDGLKDEFSKKISKQIDALPEDPLTEFQKMLVATTGQALPIFGSNLFRHAPSSFAPLDRVPVTSGYVIGPGDELLVQTWGQVTLNSRLTVDRAGNIYIPQLGTVRVAGVQFERLQPYLKTQMEHVFRNFDLNVNMGQLRSIQILVLGEARRPGSYTVSSLSTLVDALFETGGPTPQGSLRHILLKRAARTVLDFDLYDLLRHGDKSLDMQLLPGDVIFIPPSGPQVAVAGSVNLPAIYELNLTGHEGTAASTVGDVLDLAAGPASTAADAKVRIERIDAHAMRSVLEFGLDAEGRAVALRDGDVLELIPILSKYRNAVTLRGNVANPGRYAWREGMHVAELFPDKSALITRDYWLRRASLGEPVLTYIPACLAGAIEGGNAQACEGAASGVSGAAGDGPFPRDAALSARQDGASASTAEALVGRDADGNKGRFERRNDVVLSEPDIDWSYAVVERQGAHDLTTSLLPFNLGRLVLQQDHSQDIELLPGDVVTIFSKADLRVPQAQQTRLVHLEGEFVSSGVYSVLPGETLPQLVRRAGGLTPEAYIFGSEFTRESTRRTQQQRLNEYIDQIELQGETNAASLAGRSISQQESLTAAATQAQNRNLISSLRQARASGRIVLDVRPDSSLAQLPEIALEDGDRLVVPHLPSTVSVTGAVYNPNAFLYDPHRRLSAYLDIAGGANRDADRQRAYVIRADGSVISRQQISSLHHSAFDSLHVFPGDTIVVPINLNKGRMIRNIVDISQIVGQFGIALAAANLVF